MGSIEEKLTHLLGTKAAIRQAIRDKGVEVTDEDTFRSYADKIGMIDGGSLIVSREVPTVIFYDYDGSVAHSYTSEEALTLTSMPDQPQHDGLTRQGWNKTYEEMIAEVSDCGFCTVEPLYVTNDGHTRFFISIDTLGRQKYPLYINATVAGSVSVDWGDGSEEESFPDLATIDTYHFYANEGDYIITIKATEGTITFGNGTDTLPAGSNMAYRNMLKKVYIGSNVSQIADYSFYRNESLEIITAHNGITSVGANAFWGCYVLALFPMTDGVTSLKQRAFQLCRKLKATKIPSNTNSLIATRIFERCYSLEYLYIPDNITTVTDYAFAGCDNLSHIRWSSFLASIGYGSFAFVNIKEFIPPTTLTSIGEAAFASSSLKRLYISRRASIRCSDGAFSNCLNLKDAEFLSINTSLDAGVFHSSLLESINIEGSVSLSSGSGSSMSYLDKSSVSDMSMASVPEAGGFSSMPHLRTIVASGAYSTYMFRYCYSLISVKLTQVSSIAAHSFASCSSLKFVDLSEIDRVVSLSNTNAFSSCPSDYVVIVPNHLVESYKTASNWASIADHIVGSYQPRVCTSLEITADDVAAKQTTTTIHYTAVTNGFDPRTGAEREGVIVTGTATSEAFAVNESFDSTVEHTITFTYLEVTATTTITQAAAVPANFSVVLNNQWRASESVANPDESLYEGVYESFSNYNVNGGLATMYIDIDGYETFNLYIRSYAESNYDYVMVGALDTTPTTSSNYANTKGVQNSGTAIGNYKLVTFSNIDGGAHRITIVYRKDASSHSGTDRGYVLIPKNQ